MINAMKLVLSEGKISHDEILEIADKMAQKLKSADIEAYREVMGDMADRYYSIDLEEAQDIVRKMKPYGEHWNYQQVCDYMEDDDCVDYYLAMNMAYNDYSKTAETFGQKDNADFYYGIARDFIKDEDADRNKLGKYFKRTSSSY